MRNIIKLSIAISNLWLALFFTVKAQSLSTSDQSLITSRNEKTVNPALNTGVISRLSSVNLTSLFNDARAEIKVAFNAGGSVFNVGLAQSFSEKPKSVNLLDANGLTKGTTLSIAWQKMLGKPILPTLPPITDMTKFTAAIDEFKAKKGIPAGTTITYLMLDTEYKNKLVNSGAINLAAFETPWFFTFQFSANRVNFDYITDTLSTKPLSSNEVNKIFTFSLSKFTSLDVYYSLSYSAIYNYKSGDEVISYSFPIGNKGVSYSKDISVGVPTQKFESRLKAEWRQLFRDSDFLPVLGINPSLSALVNTEKINVDLPVYFITKNSDGVFNGLQAGFKVGYTNKWDDSFFRDFGSFSSDKMYFSLFLSKPFSLN